MKIGSVAEPSRLSLDDIAIPASRCDWLRRSDRDGRWDDWYALKPAAFEHVMDVPGVKVLKDGTPIVHRSHIPIVLKTRPDLCVLDDPSSPVEAAMYMHCDSQELPWATWKRCTSAGLQPRNYQIYGARFLRSRRGSLLADSMRLGKTLATCLAHDLYDGPLVVAGPLNVRPVWTKLFKQIWPDVRPVLLDGRDYDSRAIESAQLVYIHYDILPSWQSFGWRRIGLLALDEAHVLSQSRSLRGQATQLMTLRAERTVAITGTPLWNEPEGLFSVLSCIVPNAFGSWPKFVERYCSAQKTMYGWKPGAPSNVEEFKLRFAEVMLRREWKDVRDQLPVTRRDIKVLHLTPEMERQVDFLANSLRDHEAESTIIGTLARLRRILGDIKLEFLYETIQRWFGSPFVIWTWHKDVAKRVASELESRGLKVYLVHGQIATRKSKKTGEAKRESILDSWREDPEGILICTISVGQVGIDLSHASRAVFAELDFTPATIAQAEMRTFSPEREMEIIYLAVHHRVDEEIVGALKSKLESSEILGIPAADAAIEVLGSAFGMEDDGDVNRLMAAVLASDE